MTNQPKFSDTGRILAFDFGKKRIGVAVSDAMQILARPIGTITRESNEKLFSDINNFIAEFDAVAMVIGLPLNFDGTESELSGDVRKLTKKIERHVAIPIFLQDERLTSMEAEEILRERGITDWREIRKKIDSEAAAVILRDFLSIKGYQLSVIKPIIDG